MDERVAALEAATAQGRGDPLGADLYLVAVHASAAARRHQATIQAIRTAASAPEASVAKVAWSIIASGEAASTGISIYLAASAAERFCLANDEVGPLGLKRLRSLVEMAEQTRDTVMHWDDKLKRDPGTFLAFNGKELILRAPGKRGDKQPATVASIAWREIETGAQRLFRWAVMMLDLPGWQAGKLDVALPLDSPPGG